MARTKRKSNECAPMPRIYRAGIYVRLSVEDGGRQGADTVKNQEALIRGYIDSQEDMQPAGVYCDNGRTGTSFVEVR